jgi:hypothetical protein
MKKKKKHSNTESINLLKQSSFLKTKLTKYNPKMITISTINHSKKSKTFKIYLEKKKTKMKN